MFSIFVNLLIFYIYICRIQFCNKKEAYNFLPFKANYPLLPHLVVLLLLSAIGLAASTWEVSELQVEVSALKHRNFNPGRTKP